MSVELPGHSSSTDAVTPSSTRTGPESVTPQGAASRPHQTGVERHRGTASAHEERVRELSTAINAAIEAACADATDMLDAFRRGWAIGTALGTVNRQWLDITSPTARSDESGSSVDASAALTSTPLKSCESSSGNVGA